MRLGVGGAGSRYQPSQREYPEHVKAFEYGPGMRCVRSKAKARSISWRPSQGWESLPWEIRGPASVREDGQLEIYFCQERVGMVELEKN